MANEFVIKNGYFSQGDSNITGSLRVSSSIGVVGSGSDILSVYGSQGNLLTVTDTFSGSLFTVSDISGYPILDITSDYYTSSINTTGFLNHTGSAGITGSLIVSNGITGSLFGTASYVTGSVFTSNNRALSASYALTASAVSITNEPFPNTPQVRYLTYVYATGSNQSLIVTGSLTYNHQINTIFTTASQALTASYFSGFNSTSSTIGNGLSSSFNINHGFNTRNLHITVYESGSNGETVYPDIRRINADTASIIFANPPTANQYIVYISI